MALLEENRTGISSNEGSKEQRPSLPDGVSSSSSSTQVYIDLDPDLLQFRSNVSLQDQKHQKGKNAYKHDRK